MSVTRAVVRHAFPTADIDQMLAEIESGYYLVGAPHPHKTDAQRLSARDAIHAAVMERRSVSTILTFDGGFDAVPGIARLG